MGSAEPLDHSGSLVATCAGGLEEVLAGEISNRGWTVRERSHGSVRFHASAGALAEANLTLRTASRILLPLIRGAVKDYDDLYRLAGRVRWHEIVPPDRTIRVTALSSDRRLSDSRFAALRVKDAVADRQKRAFGRRSSVDRRIPDLAIIAHVTEGQAEISLDSTGKPLHMRGYRTEAGKAPLRETVAAGMLLLAGWNGRTALIDPFCGSGTIVIEAALLASGIPPSLERDDFLFLKWPDADRNDFERQRAALRETIRAGGDAEGASERPAAISGSDKDARLVAIAQRNADRAGVADLVSFRETDFFGSSATDTTIICNPPYGERLGLDDAADFYRKVGDHLKKNYTGTTAWILSANRPAMKSLGLRPSRKIPLWNGGLESRLFRFEIY